MRSANRFPISRSLPLEGTFTESHSQHFFANLLPEGNVREQICKSLKISAGNDFELLKAIGGDCAGALTITSARSSDFQERPPRYEPVTEEQLASWSVGTPNVFAAVTGQSDIRLSPAGAQDKLPVYMEGTQIMIPLGNAPSTHILKFASPHYSHLPENETFITLLAKEVGLPVVDVRIRKTAKSSITIIARYDRQLGAGQWMRRHQEDFCQALGIDASRKYEKEGGPSHKQCADLIRQHVTFPLVDLQKLLRWSLYNLLFGNADAHGKNLSLLYDRSGLPSLAPFYDIDFLRAAGEQFAGGRKRCVLVVWKKDAVPIRLKVRLVPYGKAGISGSDRKQVATWVPCRRTVQQSLRVTNGQSFRLAVANGYRSIRIGKILQAVRSPGLGPNLVGKRFPEVIKPKIGPNNRQHLSVRAPNWGVLKMGKRNLADGPQGPAVVMVQEFQKLSRFRNSDHSCSMIPRDIRDCVSSGGQFLDRFSRHDQESAGGRRCD